MQRESKALTLPKRLRKAWIILAALSTLALIAWAGKTAVNHTCLSHPNEGVNAPASCMVLPWDLAPMAIALGFWTVAFFFRKTPKAYLAYLYLFSVADLLITGAVSGLETDFGVRSFYFLMCWEAPFFYHFHISWLLSSPGRATKIFLRYLYGSGLLLSLPFLFLRLDFLETRAWFTLLEKVIRLNSLFAVIFLAILVVYDYRKHALPPVSHRIRMVLFGLLFGLAPFGLLSVIPDLLGLAYIPYSYTFPWLLLIPFAYGYAVLRPQLVETEGFLCRFSTYYLLAIFLLYTYLILAGMLSRLFPRWAENWMLAGALLSVALLFSFAPLWRFFWRLAKWMLYGSDTDYLDLVGRTSSSLSLVLDRNRLIQLLLGELPTLLPVTRELIFLNFGKGRICFQGAAGGDAPGASVCFAADGELAAFFIKNSAPIDQASLERQLMKASALDETERTLVQMKGYELWVPLVSADSLQGILILGHKARGDFYNARDRKALAILGSQAGIAAHNILLTEDLQAGRDELAWAHRQLLSGREQERRRLARELHDDAVQQLIGISYEIVELRLRGAEGDFDGAQNQDCLLSELDQLRQEILEIVNLLRGVIGELRPTSLEALGLTSALQGLIDRLGHSANPGFPQIELEMDGDENRCRLPEPVAICLFRVAQEALRNALKHASARHIWITLSFQPGEVLLRVMDDGCGFIVPERLSELARHDHFGMIGMAEHVSWANGQFEIISRPGAGTQLQVHVPFVCEPEHMPI